ncbi:MAG: asparaginase [Deltaproteobacteria bacterium]|nr:asparaginase [Deltaproteobacteria bacterium]
MKNIAIISTGGTIEKTYNPLSGLLNNEVSVLEIMLSQLTLRGVRLSRLQLMNKDSLDMKPRDHELIARTVESCLEEYDGVVVTHGTDTLERTGHACVEQIPAHQLKGPVVFTGAMRPYELRSTDALQNLTEALMAAQLLPAGVYVCMHNQVLRFPGVKKDRERLCFVSTPAGAAGAES